MVVPFVPEPGLTEVIQDGAPVMLHDAQLVVIVTELLPLPAPTKSGDGEMFMFGVAPLCMTDNVWVSEQPVMVNVAVRDWVEVFSWY